MPKRPAISVICPVHNAGEDLSACIESVLGQTLKDVELVMVNDGSTDDSLIKLLKAAKEDRRIKVFTQKNKGAAAARNHALDKATGEFVFFLDSDDYIPYPTALERLYKAATDNGVAIAGGSMCIDRDGVVDFDSLHGRAHDSFEREEVVSYRDYQYNYDYTRFIYRLDMLNDARLRFPLRSQYEDPLFHVKAMLTAGRFATVPDPVYAYRYGANLDRIWSEREIIDRIEGMMELLRLSKALHYAKLHWYVMTQLHREITGLVLDSTDNDRVMNTVFRANSLLDADLLQEVDPEIPDYFVIEPLRIILDDAKEMRARRPQVDEYLREKDGFERYKAERDDFERYLEIKEGMELYMARREEIHEFLEMSEWKRAQPLITFMRFITHR